MNGSYLRYCIFQNVWGWESVWCFSTRQQSAESSLSQPSHAYPRCTALGLSQWWRCMATDTIPKLTASLDPGPQMTKTHIYRKRGEPWRNRAGIGGCECVCVCLFTIFWQYTETDTTLPTLWRVCRMKGVRKSRERKGEWKRYYRYKKTQYSADQLLRPSLRATVWWYWLTLTSMKVKMYRDSPVE